MQSSLRRDLAERVLLLDGALGTQIQQYGLPESDTRGDIIALRRPDILRAIHRSYIDAGADIITTCTFNAQRISLSDYGMEGKVAEINRAAAMIARDEADKAPRKVYVAGSVGPTTRLLSISDDPDDPAARSVTFDCLEEAYIEQMTVLIESGVDILLIETVLDPINAKAALSAAMKAMETTGRRVELMVSATVTDSHGRLLSGQSVEAFAVAMGHAPLLSIGLNCSLGAEGLTGPLRRLSSVAPFFVSVHPNAGLPNNLGEYDDTPESMAATMRRFIDESLVNIIGGCCGTTPAHIAAMRALLDDSQYRLRKPASKPEQLQLSGLDVMESGVFVNVGERCNVAGSRKFLRLIKEGSRDEALDIARRQVEAGAMAIDINMDDGMLEAEREMTTFLNLLSGEADIARVPVMIDSSDFEVIESALQSIQGKGIVNSISLKEGEEAFLAKARTINRLGAAVVVMAFDEQGQATTYERKIEICDRAYRLLTEKAGFNPSDIIFDPNILTVATGMEDHLDYAYDVVRAARWIRANLPGANVSGGLSNLSFAFRGNNFVREAMHAVFLFHASRAGMNMAIMNPSSGISYTDIPEALVKAIEDVLFDKRDLASTERLIEIASEMAGKTAETSTSERGDTADVDTRLRRALVKGDSSSLEADLAEALKEKEAVEIISGPLMEGMNEVGRLFGEGKMFLPQVVKTARTMKRAVDILMPAIQSQAGDTKDALDLASNGAKILTATVKGDVHDIGKNIAGVVLMCNGYRVVDLGVMVPPEEIVDAVKKEQPAVVALSGLITPSLAMMQETVALMGREGLDIPVLIAGAATSEMHTAVKIAPLYSGPVVHVKDASRDPVVTRQLLDPKTRDSFISDLKKNQEELRRRFEASQTAIDDSDEALRRRFKAEPFKTPEPPFEGVRRHGLIPLTDLEPLIDWSYFYHAWKVKADSDEARELHTSALKMLAALSETPGMGAEAITGFFPAKGTDDAIVGDRFKIRTARQKVIEGRDTCLSLCDFVNPDGDYIGFFAATVSAPWQERVEALKASGDDYNTILMQTLGDRLAEAASEYLHRDIAARSGWQGIRPAVGYPSLPDQSNIFEIDCVLGLGNIGIRLTETGAMYPPSSVAGIYLPHPAARYFNA